MNATTKFFDLTATTKVKAFDNDGSLSKTDNDNNFSEAKLVVMTKSYPAPHIYLLPDFSQRIDKATR